jgi:branched-chain amino acid transport system permease protein
MKAIATARSALQHPVAGPVLRAALIYVLVVEVALQLFVGRLDLGLLGGIGPRGEAIPREVFLYGSVTGLLYGLVGMGIILVYRANRIINFAQAQLGAVPATLALLLLARFGVPYIVTIPIVVVGGALLGGVVEIGFIRRFRRSSRLVLTVVTIGVGFILLVAEFFVKVWLGGDLQGSMDFPTPWSGLEFGVGFLTFTGDHIFTVVVAGVLVAGLGALLRYTDIGIAIRASAQNTDRAALLGIPVAGVATVVWVLAGLLSAVGVFLRAPLIGLPLTGFVGPAILLLGLTAAVMARMEKLHTALLAGMLIGVIEHATLFATGRATIADIVMLGLILAALLLQRDRLSRAQEAAAASSEFVKAIRPIPAELRGVAEVRRVRIATLGLVSLLAVALPFLVGDRVDVATHGLVFAMVGVSLVVLTGWAGQISLGQFGIAGIGAAVAGGLAANHGTDFFVSLLAAGLAGALVAILIGVPALRIQGLFLAVTTLAFAFAVRNFVLTREYFGWLLPADFRFVQRPSIYGRLDLGEPSMVGGLEISAHTKFYWVTLVFLVLTLAAVRSLRRYRSGRVLIGVRDNPLVAQAFGVSPARTRLAAFALSGFIAAIAGALFVYEQGAVDPGTYEPAVSIQLFLMTVIGGIGSVMGALLGAAFVVGMPLMPVLRDIPLIEFLTSGFGLLLVLYFLPGGLADGVVKVRDTYLRWVAARHDIHVPSLIADSRVEAEVQEAADHAVEQAGRHLADVPAPAAHQLTCPVCDTHLSLDEVADHRCFQGGNGDGQGERAATAGGGRG